VATIRLAGEIFSGYNKPRRDSDGGKKFAVAAKEGDQVRLVRFGDPNMTIKKHIPERRANFRARHNCDEKKSKLTPGYWSCKAWVMLGLAPGVFSTLWNLYEKIAGGIV
jgi:hypothetical protein